MTQPKQSINLLLVEDSDSDALLVEAALRRAGFEASMGRVWSAPAMARALEQKWDAVVSDNAMPQFSAMAALELLKRRELDLPFIIVSGAIGEDAAVQLMKAGAHDFVNKGNLSRLGVALDRELREARVRASARLAESNLRNSEALLNSIVNTAADGILVASANGAIEYANPAIERMFSYKPLELIGNPLSALLPEHGQDLRPGTTLDARAARRGGARFPVEFTVNPMSIDGYLKNTIVLRDVSDRREAEERIRQLAHYDGLSGLPNRVLLCQTLDQSLEEARARNEPLAVLFIDLDRFKLINDTLGHDTGDHVLRQVSQRLAGCLTPRDVIGRLGGDEFVVIMRSYDNPARPGEMAQAIIDTLAAPFMLDGQEYHLTGSVGISTHPDDGGDAQTLLKHADIAMYRAKEAGKNAYQFHSAQMNVHSFERLVLERFLRRALEQDEFILHYQPQIEAGGGVIGMEVLLRWNNPAMGMIPPDKFIPIAEETGLIVPIGEAVLRRACEQTRLWEEQGLGPLRVAVNLSARQIAHDSLVERVAAILRDTRLDPDHLELEITESVVMNNVERAVSLLREVRAMGIHLAIDDFGTGYSSLGYLKRFPVNSVKIDRSFIMDIPADADDVAITRAVIAMAHSLRLQVTAEGVETLEQYEFLRNLGCEQMQGYYFSKPLSAQHFESYVRARRRPANTLHAVPK